MDLDDKFIWTHKMTCESDHIVSGRCFQWPKGGDGEHWTYEHLAEGLS